MSSTDEPRGVDDSGVRREAGALTEDRCQWQSADERARVPSRFTQFQTDAEGVKWAQEWYGNEPTGNPWNPLLPNGFYKSLGVTREPLSDEAWAVYLYTGTIYGSINGVFEGRTTYEDATPKPQTQEAIDGLATVFREHELPSGEPAKNRLPEGLVLYQGESRDLFEQAGISSPEQLVGKTFKWPGYSSTSIGAGPYGEWSSKAVQYRVLAPAGTPALNVMDVSTSRDEREILLGKGISWQVKRARLDSSGSWCVDIRLLDQGSN